MAIRTVATFDAFSADNDPHGEHDFGSFELAGDKFFWKSTTTTATSNSVPTILPTRKRRPGF